MVSAIADPSAPTAPGRVHPAVVVVTALAVVVVDQVTKSWALHALAGRDVDLVWTLRLHLARNSGTAFSFGAGSGWARWLPLLALAVVVVLLWQSRGALGRLGSVALGLVLGGAASNIGDRLARTDGAGFFEGRVVDFIDLQWWPVFNVADAAVVVGGILLVVATMLVPADDPGGAADDAPADDASGGHGADGE